ncbi:SGNH/GDSL hydrolase family protein [Streptosporangiaceae bacterium NEAU-GS5]|nr:SGNH/GDSL hydrolase family protein [Streptosporangiaceae bacterium NEAU-GS5]
MASGAASGSASGVGDQVLTAQRLMSFAADHRSVAAGQPVVLGWRVEGPVDGVTLRLNGRAVARSGATSVVPAGRDETYRLVAVSGDQTRELGAVVVGVNPCLPGSPPEAQCRRAGAAKGDYARINADSFVFNATDFRGPLVRKVALDGCGTDPGVHGRIERYLWIVTRLGAVVRQVNTDQCRSTVDLGEGTYGVQLTTRAADGATLAAGFPLQIKDTVVVSLGDSMASGEGNPDVNGAYIPPLPGHAIARWKDPTCHRSAYAGPVRAAQRLAADPHNGIMFLSLACTGARVTDLVSGSNRGQPPQLKQLAATLCAYACGRPVDLLTVTIGVNDVNFAQLTQTCVITRSGCDAALARAEGSLAGLKAQFAQLHDGISALGLTVKHLLITGYPAGIFSGSCAQSGARIRGVGEGLNEAIRKAAAAYGWTYVSGVTAAFTGHDYCSASSRWFVSLNESLAWQGAVDGTAHPNHVGQGAFADLILAAGKRSGAW